MLHKITKVFATNKKKDGTPIINKWGKPTWRVGIKVPQYGDQWINGFTPFDPKWEGTEQDITITESFDTGLNKNVLKFELPRKNSIDGEALKRIEASIEEIKTILKENTKTPSHLDVDGIPF